MPSTNIDRGLPSAIESEKTILGAILLDDALFDQTVGLREEHFYLDGHRRIFSAMDQLRGVSHPIDIVTLSNLLENNKDMTSVGGPAYIASLTDGIPRRPSIAQYVRIVKDKALARTLIHACNNAIAQAIDQVDPVKEVLSRVEAELFQAAQESTTRELADAGTIVREDFGGVQAFVSRKPGGSGLQTHFEELDGLTGGLQPKDLVILAARPSMGKTSYAMNIAERAALRDGKVVGIFSLEVGRDSLLTKMACSLAKVNGLDIRSGIADDGAQMRVQTALDKLMNAPIYIDDTPGLTVGDLRSKARRLKRNKGALDLIVLDYIQLMGGISSGKKGFENRTQEVSAISRGLKLIAMELECPVLALSQLSRLVESREGNEPRLSDLRESGSIEQDADVVMFLYRPEYYDREDESLRGIAKLILAKQRNGPTDTFNLAFLREWARFEDMAR